MAPTKTPIAPQTLEEYLALPYTFRVQPDPSGGYVASVDELPGCVSQGETWEETGAMIHDAMAAWISVKLEDGQPVPLPQEESEPARLLLRLPRALHQDLVRAAEWNGVSLNQYLVYLLASGVMQDAEAKGYPTPDFLRNLESALRSIAEMQSAMGQLLIDQFSAGDAALLAAQAAMPPDEMHTMLDAAQAEAARLRGVREAAVVSAASQHQAVQQAPSVREIARQATAQHETVRKLVQDRERVLRNLRAQGVTS